MQTDHDVSHHHHNRNPRMFQKMEGAVGIVMVIAIALLAIGLIYGIMSTGDATPSYLR